MTFSLFNPDASKYFVGFDKLAQQFETVETELKKLPNYPPYNIVKKDEDTYVIEMAVAGFGKTDVELTIEGDKLVIKGETTKDESEAELLYSGLAFRPFTRMFTLNDQIEVRDAEMVNGLLKVFLERVIPEEKKPKTIKVK